MKLTAAEREDLVTEKVRCESAEQFALKVYRANVGTIDEQHAYRLLRYASWRADDARDYLRKRIMMDPD
jgi:hypothetical protein